MKYREIEKLLRDNGWYRVQTTGSHQQYKHSVRPGRVTVAGKGGKDVPPGTLKSILKQAGLE
jgi:predicted RNA binding protein YcfA (HicA-like mRNA interferase family)